jgi:Trypsin-like peptidase domain
MSFPIADESRNDLDILPLFYCRETDGTPQLVRSAGTGFRFGDSLVVTCWHCVADAAPGHGYAAGFRGEDGGFAMVPLLNVTQDENGADLATASLSESPHPPEANLELNPHALTGGDDVWTYGYPLTPEIVGEDDPRNLGLNGRRLEGHVTRPFRYEHPPYGDVRCYEIDMPAPEGLSGAPLLRGPGRAVAGVLYARRQVGVISFALAHHTESLHELRGIATNRLRLADYVAGLRRP